MKIRTILMIAICLIGSLGITFRAVPTVKGAVTEVQWNSAGHTSQWLNYYDPNSSIGHTAHSTSIEGGLSMYLFKSPVWGWPDKTTCGKWRFPLVFNNGTAWNTTKLAQVNSVIGWYLRWNYFYNSSGGGTEGGMYMTWYQDSNNFRRIEMTGCDPVGDGWLTYGLHARSGGVDDYEGCSSCITNDTWNWMEIEQLAGNDVKLWLNGAGKGQTNGGTSTPIQPTYIEICVWGCDPAGPWQGYWIDFVRWADDTEYPPAIPPIAINPPTIIDQNDPSFNPDVVGNFLVTEYAFYNFYVSWDIQFPLHFVLFNFSTDFQQICTFGYKNNSGTDSFYVLPDSIKFIAYGNATFNHNATTGSGNLTMQIWLKKPLLDTWDIDCWVFVNTTDSQSDLTVTSDAFDLYSWGALEKMESSGNAGYMYPDVGALVADPFTLYAYNDSYVITRTYYRNLVHVKLLVELKWDYGNYAELPWLVPSDEYPSPKYEFGFTHYARDEWCTSRSFWVRLTLNSFGWGTGWAFAKWKLEMFNGTFPDIAWEVTFSEWFYTWYDENGGTSRVWIDLWYNRMNGSSIYGMRVGAYWYALKNSAGWPMRAFSGNDWGPMYENASNYIVYRPIEDNQSNYMSSTEIKMVEVFCRVSQPALPYNYSAWVNMVNQYDNTFDADSRGILTPAFEPPKMPEMPVGGFLGLVIAGFKAMADALYPVFTYIISGVVYLFDELFYLITGQRNVFSTLLDSIVSGVASLLQMVAVFTANVVSLVTLIVDSISWFVTNLFTYLWDIVNFILLTPSYNVLTWFGDIMNISLAWLEGGLYTNSNGQVFDFTGLATMQFQGFSGGIVVFVILFPLIFFIQCSLCIVEMSLDPILEPIAFFWGFVMWGITIFTLIWSVVHGLITLIIQLVHALRDMAPRPAGT